MNPQPCAGGADRQQREVIAAGVEGEGRVHRAFGGIAVGEDRDLCARLEREGCGEGKHGGAF